MKRLVFFASLFLVFSCDQYGPGNPYLGCLPAIQEANELDYEKHKHDEGVYPNDRQPKFDKLQEKEFARLKGTKMPLRAAHDFLSIVGDCAVFDGENYYFLMKFNTAVEISDRSTVLYNIFFCQENPYTRFGHLLLYYPQERLFSYDPRRDLVVEAGCGKGEHKLIHFCPGISNMSWDVDMDAKEIQKKMDVAVFAFSENDLNHLVKPLTGRRADYRKKSSSPEDSAINTQESFYKAAKADDFDSYAELDFVIGEEEEEDDERYYKTYELWKVLFPEKWQVIVDYRKKKIAEGNVFCVIDTDDSIFLK